MKIVVMTTRVPFIHGGAEQLRDNLIKHLRAANVEAEAVSLPFSWDPAERLVDEMRIAKSLELINADRVIALKFPAYLVPHHDKIFWLVHQYRQAYDLWDAGQSNIPDTPRGEEIRRFIRAADDQAFGEAKALYAVSPVIVNRLRHYNGFHAESLPSPLNDPELFNFEGDDGYILASGRVGDAKRQMLLIEALHYAPSARLVIAGPPDAPGELERLRRRAEDLDVVDRVTFDLRFLPRGELAALVNRAAAIAYLPFQEDSVGYVTMEAFRASKPVLTVEDSGGVLEIVRHDETGLVVRPEASAIGEALSSLVSSKASRQAMGRSARELSNNRGLTWANTIEKLLS